jgi:CoA-transferase family III
MSRAKWGPHDIIRHIWRSHNLPERSISQIQIAGYDSSSSSAPQLLIPSSFKIGQLAVATIALSAAAADAVYSLRNLPAGTNDGEEAGKVERKIDISAEQAVLEFICERLFTINGVPPASSWGPIGGLHKTRDGYVRIHDNFPNHRRAALGVLKLPENAGRADVAGACLQWNAVDLEAEAFKSKGVIAALRSYEEWEATPQAAAVLNEPIRVAKFADGERYTSLRMTGGGKRCLAGLRVLEFSRVIAAPVAGKTLAAHGADVLWVTSPTLPDLPALDPEMSRGKRSIQLDLRTEADREKLKELAKDADVFINGYRPGALQELGFSAEELWKVNKNLVYANMSAYGPEGPWALNRGFDSLVQTCSGMNVSEAEHFGAGEPARPTPCQALDHGAGFLLAFGIMAAVYKRATEGGKYVVDVSLAGVMKFLRSLGQFEGKSGFDMDWKEPRERRDEIEKWMLKGQTEWGEIEYLGHAASIEGLEVGWERMPGRLGKDEAVWPNAEDHSRE